MAEDHAIAHDAPHPNYMAIFWWLLGATIAEVAVTYLGLPQAAMIVVLLVMAFGKAALVALYFMHLKYDYKVLMIIAVVPVNLAGIAISVLSFEYTHYTISPTAHMTKAPAVEAESE